MKTLTGFIHQEPTLRQFPKGGCYSTRVGGWRGGGGGDLYSQLSLLNEPQDCWSAREMPALMCSVRAELHSVK